MRHQQLTFNTRSRKLRSWRTVECPADCEEARSAQQVHCILETNGDGGQVKDNIYCTDLPKPGELTCSGPCIAYGEWTECCHGQTNQQRRAYCKSNPNNGYPLPDQYCIGMPRDGAMRQCDVHDCPTLWEIDTSAPVGFSVVFCCIVHSFH